MKKNIALGLVFLAFTLAGCSGSSETSEPQKIEGRLTDEGGSPIAGATVQIFTVQNPDTLAARLSSEYNTGAPVSSATDFDHRFYGTAVATTSTGQDGGFSLDASGRYHIAITHSNYSWRYIYNAAGKLGDVKTKPVIRVNGALGTNIQWTGPGQDYVVTASAVVPGNSQFTVGAGVRVRFASQTVLIINQGSTVNISGTIEQPVIFTPDSNTRIRNFYSGVQINSSTVQCEYAKFSGASSGVKFSKCSGLVRNSFMENSNTGAVLVQCGPQFVLRNCIARNCENSGFRCEQETGSLANLLSHDNDQKGIDISQSSNLKLSNSYLQADEYGAFVGGTSTMDAENCEMSGKLGGAFLQGAKGRFTLCNLRGATALFVHDINSGGGQDHQADCDRTNFYASANTIVSMMDRSSNTFTGCYFNGTATMAEILLRLPVNSASGSPAVRVVTNPVFSPVAGAGLRK